MPFSTWGRQLKRGGGGGGTAFGTVSMVGEPLSESCGLKDVATAGDREARRLGRLHGYRTDDAVTNSCVKNRTCDVGGKIRAV
jgi:hypothetical protein